MRMFETYEFDYWILHLLQKILDTEQAGRDTLIVSMIWYERYPISVVKILVDRGLIQNVSNEIDEEGNPFLKIKVNNRIINNKYKPSYCFGRVTTWLQSSKFCYYPRMIKRTDPFLLVWGPGTTLAPSDRFNTLMTSDTVFLKDKIVSVRALCYIFPIK